MAALDFTDGFTAAEALQMVRALLNEPTASYWTNDEINKWIQEAVMDITTKTLCYEKSDDITLAATTRVYGTIGTSDSVDDVLKIYGCIFNSGATPPVYRGNHRGVDHGQTASEAPAMRGSRQFRRRQSIFSLELALYKHYV